MKFWNKGKVHPCLGYHIPNTPNTHKTKNFTPKHRGNLNGGSEMAIASTGTNKRILVVLDYSVLDE